MLTIWYNPACSKSRAALTALEGIGRPLHVRAYLQDSPTPKELAWLSARVEGGAAALLRATDEVSVTSPAAEILAAIARDPALLQRPLVVAGERVWVVRTAEALAQLVAVLTADDEAPSGL